MAQFLDPGLARGHPSPAVDGSGNATAVYVPSTRLRFGLLLLLGLFLLGDVVTTSTLITAGGYEGNPLMIVVVQSPVLHLLVKCVAFLSFLVIASIAGSLQKHADLLCIAVATAMAGAPFLWNLYQCATCL